jgi:hypothetical protein
VEHFEGKDDEIMQKLLEMVDEHPERFYVVEAQVDVNLQLEYFERSVKIRKKNQIIDVDVQIGILQSDLSSEEEKKDALIFLAGSDDIKAYRFIEQYLENPASKFKNWGVMAHQESRMVIETSFLEESRVFISSGLGGKQHKLSSAVAFVLQNNTEFHDFQKNTIRNELKYSFKNYNAELEDVMFSKTFVRFICLVPLQVNLQILFREVIEEINTYGDFLSQRFLVTNEHRLSEEEVLEMINTST